MTEGDEEPNLYNSSKIQKKTSENKLETPSSSLRKSESCLTSVETPLLNM